jgi:hypothetical protein
MRSSANSITVFSLILITFAFICLPLSNAYAHRGCCSRHGGVVGCNNATGRQLCKDGTTSPSCACDGRTIKKNKTMRTTTETTTTAPAAAAATTAPAATQKGCCSRHGGVKGCDKRTGRAICKDNSRSSCTC